MTIGHASIQAGKATEQGPIANVTLGTMHARRGSPSARSPSRCAALGSNETPGRSTPAPTAARRQPPNSNISQMFQNGCSGPFAVKSRRSDNCATNSTPFDCVRGITHGGSHRSTMTTTTAGHRAAPAPRNNWPDIPTGDPRLVTVFLTDAIPGRSRERRLPHHGFRCVLRDRLGRCASSAGRVTTDRTTQRPDERPAVAVWGHYFKLVLPSADGTPGTAPCNPNDSAACIAVLVR